MNLAEPMNMTEAALADMEPLPVLFSHKCSDPAHSLHEELKTHFAEEGMCLLIDPFAVGEDVSVSMRRLHIHGAAFHVTPESINSKPVETELTTARRLHVPIMALADGASVPGDLRNRIYVRLPGLAGNERAKVFRSLAQQMRPRARVHAALVWLCQSERTVEEREDGIRWLCGQSGQVLAEFFDLIASLHKGVEEDNIVCRWLAQVLARTGLPDACGYLHQWWLASDHPNARYGLEQAMQALRCPLPSNSAKNLIENRPTRKDTNNSLAKPLLRTWVVPAAGAAMIGIAAFCYFWTQGHAVDLTFHIVITEVKKHPDAPALPRVQTDQL